MSEEQRMEELPRVPVPEEYEVDMPLRDGSTVHLRPIRPDDDGMMIALFNRFSPLASARA